MSVYYNEFDPKAAAWLRELIKAGHLPDGMVDERSIVDVKPKDLKGHTQCHFFAGIGGWPLALGMAGWDSRRPVWTGSCPCQPFSQANSWKRENDERNLWPVFFHLIRECNPAVVLGEQVASPAGLAWLDTVFTDLEGADYARGAADLCAAGVGAPHIRQRLYWVALSGRERLERERLQLRARGSHEAVLEAWGRCQARELGNASSAGSGRHSPTIFRPQTEAERRLRRVIDESVAAGVARLVGDTNSARSQGRSERRYGADELSPWTTSVAYVHCTDGKVRPVEPGSFPLAHGVPGRVGLLRGYGNAIVPQVAATFIQAVMEGSVK